MPRQRFPQWFRHWYEDVFELDLRSLALFRIGLGLLVLLDLLFRLSFFQAFQSDEGFMPRALAITLMEPWRWSLYLAGGDPFQLVLYGLAALAAAALFLGYRTRAATVVSWILLMSLQNRNLYIGQGGDDLLRLLLFWSMFLPLGERFSWEGARERAGDGVVSAGSVGLVVQIALVYVFAAILKLTVDAWRHGLGVYYALSAECYATAFGHWLSRFPGLLKVSDFAVLGCELLVPLLLFIPLKSRLNRVVVCVLFFGLQLLFAASLKIGLFPAISIVALLPLIPGSVWERFKPAGERGQPNPRLGALGSFAATLALVYILMWNVADLPRSPVRLTGWRVGIGHLFGLGQYWNMYSIPIIADGWYVIPARLANGQLVDLFSGGRPLSWGRPETVSSTYMSDRWRKYLVNLHGTADPKLLLSYGRYLCRSWNATHFGGTQLETFQIIFMRQDILPAGGETPPRKVLLWNHECAAGGLKRFPINEAM